MARSLDPTDFPVLPLPRLGLAVQLLPVTKVQFEYMLGDGRGDPVAYEEILQTNPRTSWRAAAGAPAGLFLTGVRPEEAEAFGRWLGGGFRLPTDVEWKAIDAMLADPANPANLRAAVASEMVHPAARAILSGLSVTTDAGTAAPRWRQVGLFEGGILEWVRTRTGFGLHGRPRPSLYNLIHNPQIHDAVRPREVPPPRHPAFGFRLVRPLPAGGAA